MSSSSVCMKVTVATVVALLAISVVLVFQAEDLGAFKLLKLKLKLKEKGHELREKGHELTEKAVGVGGETEEAVGNVLKKIGSALSFGKPSADFKGLTITHFTTEDIKIKFHVEVKNPNPIAIPLAEINYKVVINDREFVKGTIPDGGTLGMHHSKVIDIGVELAFKDVTDTFKDLNPGSFVKYIMRATFLFDLPVVGRVEIPIDHDGDFAIPAIPDVDLDEIDWLDLSFTETKAVAHVKLENLNAFTMRIKSFDYKLYLTDDLISEGKMEKAIGVEQKEVTRLAIPFTFRPKDLGRAVWDIISGSESGYKLEGAVSVESPFGPLRLPFAKGGATVFKKKSKKDSK